MVDQGQSRASRNSAMGSSALTLAGNVHAALWPSVSQAMAYRGPERRTGAAVMARLMALALDEIDYGMLVINDEYQVLHANHAARVELEAGEHPLTMEGGQLRVRQAQDLLVLQEALLGASRRGLRKLLSLGTGAARAGVSVVPLPALPGDPLPGATLLVLGKSQVCGALSVQGFARAHRLSPGEEQVLIALCDGRSPGDIAKTHGVAISTVRTQIANIRAKTGSVSIRDLIQQVALLPPLVGALRQKPEARTAAPAGSASARAMHSADHLLEALGALTS
ncbi:helix-turn-helix transcriptional regulator [Ideonella azotifigens]|nr:helix-turn-helix transcriptional regulator [Ideonella azotifigens]MCD2339814.1 helix-turn-helix transcriptional regulator [Ideonella azotifigens]